MATKGKTEDETSLEELAGGEQGASILTVHVGNVVVEQEEPGMPVLRGVQRTAESSLAAGTHRLEHDAGYSFDTLKGRILGEAEEAWKRLAGSERDGTGQLVCSGCPPFDKSRRVTVIVLVD